MYDRDSQTVDYSTVRVMATTNDSFSLFRADQDGPRNLRLKSHYRLSEQGKKPDNRSYSANVGKEVKEASEPNGKLDQPNNPLRSDTDFPENQLTFLPK